MNIRTAFFLGIRPLLRVRMPQSSGRQLAGTIFGIALSLVPLILVVQLSNGMIQGIMNRYIETYSYHLQVKPYMEAEEELMAEVHRELASMEGVSLAVRERQGYGLAYAPAGGREGVTLRSLPADLYRRDASLRHYITFQEGGWDLEEPGTALLGLQLAEKLGVSRGDQIKILTGKNVRGRGYIPRVSTLTVQGVFTTGYQDLDKMWVVVNREQGESMLFKGTSEEFLGLKVPRPYESLNPLIMRIKGQLSAGWSVYPWQTLNSSQAQNYETTKALLIFIMGLILAVAVVNISSSLVMLVLENQQEIAILKGLGASPRGITLSYVITGVGAGLAGILLGTAAGLLVAVNINGIITGLENLLNQGGVLLAWINPYWDSPLVFDLVDARYYLEKIPIRISWQDVAPLAAGGAGLSLLVSWWPARRAARIKPLEVLQRV